VVWARDKNGHGLPPFQLSGRRHPSPGAHRGARLRGMEIRGYLAEDAPDPRDALRARIADLGIPVASLVPQRHLEDRGEVGIHESTGGPTGGDQVLEEVSVTRGYLLWRNPDDHDDPENLADLDDALRSTLDAPLARPLPPWVHEARRMLRYPRLWDAVQTHWTRPDAERPAVAERLLAHAEHVLTNSFREQLGLKPMEWVSAIPTAALQPHPVVVDGVERTGLLLDTDPLVLGLAAALDDGRVLTAVVSRDALPLVVLQFASDVPVATG
jgi:hypothetical protein